VTKYVHKWYGKKAASYAEEMLKLFLGQWGLHVEGKAKEQLYWGHGMVTGTLRRSIHSAEPGYNWPGDDVAPSAETPERGGEHVEPAREGKKLVIEVGSGMVYARKIEDLYHYMENAVKDSLNDAPRILKWAAKHVGG